MSSPHDDLMRGIRWCSREHAGLRIVCPRTCRDCRPRCPGDIGPGVYAMVNAAHELREVLAATA